MSAAPISSAPSALENSKLTFQQMQEKISQSLDALQLMESSQAMKSGKILSWEVQVIISTVKGFFAVVYPEKSLDAMVKGPDPFLRHLTDLGGKYPSQVGLINRIKQVFSRYWAQLEISKSTRTENGWVQTTWHWNSEEKRFVSSESERKA